MRPTGIISVVLRHVFVNFMIADEICVKWASHFSGNTEIKKQTINIIFSIVYFFYPNFMFFYYFGDNLPV